MKESEIVDELRDALSDAHLSTDVHAVIAAGRARGRRRTLRRTASGVTAGAAVLAIVAGAVNATHDPSARREASPRVAATPQLETVDYVRPLIVRAIDASRAIVRTTYRDSQQGSSQTDVNAVDTVTGYNTFHLYDDAGRLIEADHAPVQGAGRETDVDYTQKTYVVFDADTRAGADRLTGKLGEPLLDSPAGIRAAVQGSNGQIVGHQKINGQEAVHLRFTVSKDGNLVRGDAWFDAQTYVPLRARTSYSTGGKVDVVSDTEWLPRTAANIAKTSFSVPAGFRRVPPHKNVVRHSHH